MEESAYANDAIIFQHQQQQQQQQQLQLQQGILYSGGADLSNAPLPPLPPSGYNAASDSNPMDGYSYPRHSRHSDGFDWKRYQVELFVSQCWKISSYTDTHREKKESVIEILLKRLIRDLCEPVSHFSQSCQTKVANVTLNWTTLPLMTQVI